MPPAAAPNLATAPPYPSEPFRIIRPMSETYQSKRKRWKRLQAELPDSLRPHVSLRNVEAVSKLTPDAQRTLAEAIEAGMQSLPQAIKALQENPALCVSDLLGTSPAAAQKTEPAEPDISPETREELADLIQLCYPDMLRLSAEALTEAEAMQVVGLLTDSFMQVFASRHIRSDFVLVVLFALLQDAQERIEALIDDTPSAQSALTQSDLPYIPTKWRKTHA